MPIFPMSAESRAPDSTADGELLRRVAAGDLEAFRALVGIYQRRIFGLCSRLLNHPQNTEDVAQDVFFQVYQAAAAFRHDCAVSTWIYRITVNRCRNFNRDHRRESLETELPAGPGDGIPNLAAASEGEDPEAALSLNETRAIIRKAVASLPEKQRVMLVLNKFDGLSYQEIAGITGASLAAVESGLHRAKLNLQKKLAPLFPVSGGGRKF